LLLLINRHEFRAASHFHFERARGIVERLCAGKPGAIDDCEYAAPLLLGLVEFGRIDIQKIAARGRRPDPGLLAKPPLELIGIDIAVVFLGANFAGKPDQPGRAVIDAG
jgi:hypothetical protein